MIAEDNKEVKKKRDGKSVNRIDGEELHERPGCFGARGGTIRGCNKSNSELICIRPAAASYSLRHSGRAQAKKTANVTSDVVVCTWN